MALPGSAGSGAKRGFRALLLSHPPAPRLALQLQRECWVVQPAGVQVAAA